MYTNQTGIFDAYAGSRPDMVRLNRSRAKMGYWGGDLLYTYAKLNPNVVSFNLDH